MELISSLGLCFHKLLCAFIGFAAIGAIISFHELGHFLFCKLFHIYTPSFSIGFGPKIISRTIGSTEFSLRAIPLGGFVEIAGSAEIGQGEQKEAYNVGKHSFSSKPYYQRLLVMIGGIIFNLLFAYGAFILIYWTGLPKTPILYPRNAQPIIEAIQENSFAHHANLQVGDRILAYNDNRIKDTILPFIQHVQSYPQKPLSLTIERNHVQQNVTLELAPLPLDTPQAKSLGIQFAMTETSGIPFVQAIKNGIQLTNYYIYQTIMGFVSLFKKRDISQMAGPIGIISLTVKGAEQGFKVLLALLALLSINLAVLNLLPLPILDGGQIMFNTIEAIIKRPVPAQTKEYIFMASWVLIILLILYLSIKDVTHLFLRPLFRLLGK